jgi:hypothetical protein
MSCISLALLAVQKKQFCGFPAPAEPPFDVAAGMISSTHVAKGAAGGSAGASPSRVGPSSLCVATTIPATSIFGDTILFLQFAAVIGLATNRVVHFVVSVATNGATERRRLLPLRWLLRAGTRSAINALPQGWRASACCGDAADFLCSSTTDDGTVTTDFTDLSPSVVTSIFGDRSRARLIRCDAWAYADSCREFCRSCRDTQGLLRVFLDVVA